MKLNFNCNLTTVAIFRLSNLNEIFIILFTMGNISVIVIIEILITITSMSFQVFYIHSNYALGNPLVKISMRGVVLCLFCRLILIFDVS